MLWLMEIVEIAMTLHLIALVLKVVRIIVFPFVSSSRGSGHRDQVI